MKATSTKRTLGAEALDRLATPSRREAARERQRGRRQREARARFRAADACCQAAGEGPSCAQQARQLGIAPRTLTHWQQGEPAECCSRGRPCKESSWILRQAVLEILDAEGPYLGIPTLRALMPEVPRCELIDLKRAYEREFVSKYRVSVESLTWNLSGSVWAMDHAEPSCPVDGCHDAIFAVRDLASGMQLAWLPVVNQTAETTALALADLFHQHGPPLVLKSDNGSAFTSVMVQELLASWGIHWLPSPPRTPQYNGSCEAGIGSLKKRTAYRAARHGRLLEWSSDDLDAARRQANELSRPHGHLAPSPHATWSSRAPLSMDSRTLLADVYRRRSDDILQQEFHNAAPLSDNIHAHIHRSATRRTLIQLGLLSITRRSITLPFRRLKSAKIS